MLFRVFVRIFSAKAYFNYYFCLLTAKIVHFKNDYSKDLSVIFYLLVFKPIYAILQFILFCLNTIWFIVSILIKANNIVFRFIFIKSPINILTFFLLLCSYKIRYLVMEFFFMFVDSYILSFKDLIKSTIIECRDILDDFIYWLEPKVIEYGPENPNMKVYGNFAMEMYPEEYQEYRDSFEKNPGPDLNVYYPMRFALSSVMIRLTGVILAISFFLALFFLFINSFIIVNANPSELRRSVDYKFIETLQSYLKQYQKYTLNPEKYNTFTYYSLVKCMMIIIYTHTKICLKYLFFDAYIRFNLMSVFKIKYLTLNFFYIFFGYIFIYTLPIHLYYVVYHSYKLIYISTYIGYFYNFLKKVFNYIFKISSIVVKKIWIISYEIATVEEPPVEVYSFMKKYVQTNEQNNNNDNDNEQKSITIIK